jgi:nicotinamide-nucleotide amidase
MVQDASVLASILARRLKLAGLFISTAESCTGGMVASALTDIQGASKWFRQGWITYSNETKTRQLGVPEELFDDDVATGAVSPEVAAAMAMGAAKESNSEVAIGVTGIAGPTGATENKEVGLVWVGTYIDGKVITKSAEFGQGDRHSNKEAFTTFALRVALEAWDELREDEEEELVIEVEDVKEPTIPEALKQLSNGEIDEEWRKDVAWSEGDEEPEIEEPAIPESDIAWNDDE